LRFAESNSPYYKILPESMFLTATSENGDAIIFLWYACEKDTHMKKAEQLIRRKNKNGIQKL
jgi:hypothetical protein